MEREVNCVYWGLFLDDDTDVRFRGKLGNTIEHKHVTFGFRTPCPESLVGTKWKIRFNGNYGLDDRNEAFEVDIPNELADVYKGAKVPHLTVSVSDNGKPVDSAYLDFEPVYEPFEVEMTMGYFPGGNSEPVFSVSKKCHVVQRTDWDFNYEDRHGCMVEDTKVLKVFEDLCAAKKFIEWDAGYDADFYGCQWSVSNDGRQHRYSGSCVEGGFMHGMCYDILTVELA